MENQGTSLTPHKSRHSNLSLKIEGNLMHSMSYLNTSQAESSVKYQESKLESPHQLAGERQFTGEDDQTTDDEKTNRKAPSLAQELAMLNSQKRQQSDSRQKSVADCVKSTQNALFKRLVQQKKTLQELKTQREEKAQNSKHKKEIRTVNGFASPSVQEFERIVQRTETNKLLTYYNKHKQVLECGSQ